MTIDHSKNDEESEDEEEVEEEEVEEVEEVEEYTTSDESSYEEVVDEEEDEEENESDLPDAVVPPPHLSSSSSSSPSPPSKPVVRSIFDRIPVSPQKKTVVSDDENSSSGDSDDDDDSDDGSAADRRKYAQDLIAKSPKSSFVKKTVSKPNQPKPSPNVSTTATKTTIMSTKPKTTSVSPSSPSPPSPRHLSTTVNSPRNNNHHLTQNNTAVMKPVVKIEESTRIEEVREKSTPNLPSSVTMTKASKNLDTNMNDPPPPPPSTITNDVSNANQVVHDDQKKINAITKTTSATTTATPKPSQDVTTQSPVSTKEKKAVTTIKKEETKNKSKTTKSDTNNKGAQYVAPAREKKTEPSIKTIDNNKEVVDVVEEETKPFGWEKPDWAKKGPKLRTTNQGAALKSFGNLAAPITSLPHQTSDGPFTKPAWLNDEERQSIRQGFANHIVKNDGRLERPVTTLPDLVASSSSSLLSSSSSSLLSSSSSSLPRTASTTDDAGGIGWQKPDWAKKGGAAALKGTAKGDALRSGGTISRPIGGIKPLESK
jgi:hypothetical protein